MPVSVPGNGFLQLFDHYFWVLVHVVDAFEPFASLVYFLLHVGQRLANDVGERFAFVFSVFLEPLAQDGVLLNESFWGVT